MVEETTERRGALTWAGGRVRRSATGRHRRVGVRVTDDELNELRRRASLAGVSPPRYLLEQGLCGGEVTVAERRRRIAEFSAVQGQLGRLVAALETLVAVAQASGDAPVGAVEAVAGVGRLRHDLAEALDGLMDGVGGLGR